MIDFLQTEESSCSCKLLKSCELSKKLSFTGNKNSDTLFLMSLQYPKKQLNLFNSFISKFGYTEENSAKLNAIGCVPKNYNLTETFLTYSECKDYNVKKSIESMHPKVIVTEGAALYTICEEANVKHSYFIDFKNSPTFFWSYEFNCWVFPIPPVNSWIINDKENKSGGLISVDNYMRLVTRFQLEKIKEIKNTKPRIIKFDKITVEDPIEFLKENIKKDITKIAVDTETEGFKYYQDKLISIQLCWESNRGYFIKWREDQEFKTLLNTFLKDKYLIGANGKFDSKMLIANGITDIKFSFDVNYAGHFLTSYRSNSLKASAFYYTTFGGYENELDRYKKNYNIKTYSDIPIKMLTDYSVTDTVLTYRLESIFRNLLNENQLNLLLNVYIPLSNLFAKIEMKGLNIDMDALVDLREKYTLKCKTIEDIIHKEFPNINLNSDADLAEMFKKLKAKGYLIHSSGDYSTADAILKKWEADGVKFAKEILEYRKYSTSLKMFLSEKSGLVSNIDPKDGRVHPSFNLQYNRVGRLSCSQPNVQQLPVKSDVNFRKIFKAKEGYYIAECDYSGFHLRLVAIASGDPVMCSILKSSNKDIHSKTASFLFTNYTFDEYVFKLKNGSKEEKKLLKDYRNNCKKINFGLIYGMAYYKLAHDILMDPKEGWAMDKVLGFLKLNNIKDDLAAFSYLGKQADFKSQELLYTVRYEAAAKLIRTKFFEEYSGLNAWIEKMYKDGKEKGYVDTPMGFRVHFSELTHPHYTGREKIYNNLLNVSVNGGIIGLEANIMQETQILLDEFFVKNKYDAYMINQIHDSVLLEIREDLIDELREPVKKIMSRDKDIYKGIPIAAEGHYGRTWMETEGNPWEVWFEE